MYTMKEACKLTGMTYENLKFYCNEGLVPNVKRDKRNYRVFDEHDIKWIQSLNCLKNCGMSIAEMKEYLALCLEGQSSIPERKVILENKKKALLESIEKLQQAVAYIDWKQGFYDDVLSGKTKYYSNLIPELHEKKDL
ncbi:MAG: MerR family transcriptional regulator [Roseburia sp.]|nr:MerR family transcriptional regulator [Roseburia sp.]MDY5883161.1 MerR family transcriptional regulator [Roseburia sp.]